MGIIDRIYTNYPFYGSRRMLISLQTLGYHINRKRVRRLMQEMGLEAIYPRPNLSQINRKHKKYPYLIKGLKIEFPNQVWSADITYIKLSGVLLIVWQSLIGLVAMF